MSIVQVIDSLEKYFIENVPSLYVTSDSSDSDIAELVILNSYNLNNTPNDIQISGDVQSFSSGLLTGNNTFFLDEYVIDDPIKINDEVRRITDIESNTLLYVDEDFYTINSGDNIYKPSGSEIVILDDNNNLYQTDQNLTGWNISNCGESISIFSHDLTNSKIRITKPFSNYIESMQEMIISKKSWGFFKMPNLGNKGKSCNYFKEQKNRIYFYLKTKDDSNKRSMYKLIDSIKDVIYKTNNFPIYLNDSFVDIIGYGKFNDDINITEGFESDGDLQSYVVDFQIQYYEKY